MSQLFAPSLDEQILCLEREIAMRTKVYPRWVESKKMTEAKANREIEVMKAAVESLRSLTPK